MCDQKLPPVLVAKLVEKLELKDVNLLTQTNLECDNKFTNEKFWESLVRQKYSRYLNLYSDSKRVYFGYGLIELSLSREYVFQDSRQFLDFDHARGQWAVIGKHTRELSFYLNEVKR